GARRRASFVCFVSFVGTHPFHSHTAWQETARLLRELDSTSRKILGMIGEGLSILTRQPWPALNQTNQLGIGVTHIEPKMLRFLLRAVRCRFDLFS
ncbi:MAG: hypothetical protein NTZ32_17170, partial [Planctomycetales bacterium]|nr:hypothetical protein [Planctomycetales bacterium]